MLTVILATQNQGKLTELQSMFAKIPINIKSQRDFGLPSIPETGVTFVENALLKARHSAYHTKLPSIADDSGLEVDYLQGKPGIHSARYAGVNASDENNNHKLLTALKGVPESERTARYQCVIVFIKCYDDPSPVICHGTWEGQIALSPHGQNGFGYDPIFYLPSLGCCAAELPADIKNRLSHRGQALQCLLSYLSTHTLRPSS